MDIDGIRALAVSAVVLFHVHVPGLTGGFVGVDVFFVLSGYLMVGIIYREMLEGSFSTSRFYARRIRRILPALMVLLMVVWAAAQFVLTPRENNTFSLSTITTLLGVSNYQFWAQTNYFSDDSRYNPLLMTWSLGVEEQFYIIILPIMIYTIGHVRRSLLFPLTLVLCLGSLAFAQYALVVSRIGPLPTRSALSFYWLPTRAWELGMGALLVIAEIDFSHFSTIKTRWRELSGVAGLAMVIFAVVTYREDTVPFPGISAVLPCMGSVLMLAGEGSFVNRRLLSLLPIRLIGLVSYSWYLWHWPLLSLTSVSLGAPLSLGVAGLVALVSLACAWASYRWVETPLRRSTLPPQILFRRYAWVVGLMMLPCLLAVATRGFADAHPPQLGQIEAALEQSKHNPCLAHDGVTTADMSPVCAPDPHGRPLVVLLGDSHAAALGFGLRDWAREHGEAAWIITKSSCPTLTGFTRYFAAHPAGGAECAAFNAAAIRNVANDPRVGTVLVTAFWDAGQGGDASWYSPVGSGGKLADWRVALYGGLGGLINTLHQAHKRVVVILDDPRPTFNPVRRAEAAYMPLRRWLAGHIYGLTAERYMLALPAEVAPNVTNGTVRAIAAAHGAQIVEPRNTLCDPHGCRFAAGSDVLYVDDQHLSSPGGARVLSVLPLR
jgi:peptidoglycan/LPS O-acetylase OafA/YrhL